MSTRASALAVRPVSGSLGFGVIELKDPSWKDGTWISDFCQGSTGGAMTSVALTETFLQRGYRGEWIDGIQFYYRGKPFVDADHTSIGGLIYRTGDD